MDKVPCERVSCWVVPLTDKAIVAKDLANTDINLKEFSNVHQTKTAYLCKGQYGSEKSMVLFRTKFVDL